MALSNLLRANETLGDSLGGPFIARIRIVEPSLRRRVSLNSLTCCMEKPFGTLVSKSCERIQRTIDNSKALVHPESLKVDDSLSSMVLHFNEEDIRHHIHL